MLTLWVLKKNTGGWVGGCNTKYRDYLLTHLWELTLSGRGEMSGSLTISMSLYYIVLHCIFPQNIFPDNCTSQGWIFLDVVFTHCVIEKTIPEVMASHWSETGLDRQLRSHGQHTAGAGARAADPSPGGGTSTCALTARSATRAWTNCGKTQTVLFPAPRRKGNIIMESLTSNIGSIRCGTSAGIPQCSRWAPSGPVQLTATLGQTLWMRSCSTLTWGSCGTFRLALFIPVQEIYTEPIKYPGE